MLNPPLIEEEISADLSAIIDEASELDDLDMMTQSAGPFQPHRSLAQNYGHSNTNMYHRQASYHPHHHHQVSRFTFDIPLSVAQIDDFLGNFFFFG